MRRSAVTIWRSALSSVEDLPDCPPDLTEPGFANLLFDHHCHVRRFCATPQALYFVSVPGDAVAAHCIASHSPVPIM